MKFVRKIFSKLNAAQKNVAAIFIPASVFIFAIPMAIDIGHFSTHWIRSRSQPVPPPPPSNWDYLFNIDENWWVWLIALGLIGYLEFNLFSDKK